MFDGGEFCSSTNSAECFSSSSFSSGMCSQSKKKGNNKNMRRFSDEQINSLESMFETETKLDPRKKLQLARELGLQPRQVAIWFQNKRARWKSKQLERDYSILKANYNNLASQYECLKKEKQSLVMQLQKLNDLMMEKPHKEASPVEDTKPTLSFDLSEHGGVGVISDEDSSIKAHYFGLDQDPDLLKMVEAADSTSLTSPENWGSLDDGLLDQHSTPNQWWDFWS